jgi:hypothetical protein
VKWLLLILAGCDAQAGDGYRGEAMARLQGMVLLGGPLPAGPIDAALLWDTTWTAPTPIVVEKSFPARFKMAIYVPPPPEVVTGGHAQGKLAAISHTATAEDLAAGMGLYGRLDNPTIHFFEEDCRDLLLREYGPLTRGYHLISRTPTGTAVTQADVDACAAELTAWGDQSQLCRDELLPYRREVVPFETSLTLEVGGP